MVKIQRVDHSHILFNQVDLETTDLAQSLQRPVGIGVIGVDDRLTGPKIEDWLTVSIGPWSADIDCSAIAAKPA